MNNNENKGSVLGLIVFVILMAILFGSCSGGGNSRNEAKDILDRWTNEGPDSLNSYERDAVEHILNN